MIFTSKLPMPERPSSDVFNYIFHEGRDEYSRDKVIYKVHETGETLTLRELEQLSRKFASILVRDYDIKPNDSIAVLAHNSIWYPVIFFGSLASGATICPIPMQKGLDALFIAPRLQQSQAKVVITDRDLIAVSQEAALLSGDIPLISLDPSGVAGVADLQTILPSGDPTFDAFKLSTREDQDSHNAFIYRTSGSSGNIKCVQATHAHWNANLLSTKLTVPKTTDPSTDVWLSTLPLSYGINAKLNLGLNILLGIPVIILLKPFTEALLPIIPKYGITFLFMTPPLAASIAKSPSKASYPSIKWLLCAGAPVHPKIRDAVQEKFAGTRLSLEWGTTETLLIALQIDDASSVPGSSGTLVNGMEVRVIDVLTKEDVGGYNRPGEILVRNALVKFAGYKDERDRANGDFDAEGWFHSGDLGYVDEDCNVFIVDRLKELLRVGDGYGTHVSNGEIEGVLFDHPAVATAVVVGIRDLDTQQEHPTGFIVLKPDFKAKADATLALDIELSVERVLGSFRRLSGGVYFIDAYPQTGFKVNRQKLKTLVNVGEHIDRTQRLISVAV